MNPELAANEKTTPAWVVKDLRQTGGMFGLRTAHDETRTYTKTAVANSCQGSTRSLAQAYEFGRLGLKVSMAFGADLNGFIQQTRPRFGNTGACSAGFRAEADAQMNQQRLTGPGRLGTDFDVYGLAHVGLLPDVVKDLKQLGVNTSGLENSTEKFIQMWERANTPRTGMADAAADMDTTGVAAYVPKATREASYPSLCGKAYSPNSKLIGDTCRFAQECVSAACTTSEGCSGSTGSCICDGDNDCATNQYCGVGLNLGQCRNKQPRGALCTAGRECLSGKCSWLTCT
jgi:hypothetical protein